MRSSAAAQVKLGVAKWEGKVARKGRLNVLAPLFLFCPGASDLEAAELQSVCRSRPLCLSASLGGRHGAAAASCSRSLLQLPPPRPSPGSGGGRGKESRGLGGQA